MSAILRTDKTQSFSWKRTSAHGEKCVVAGILLPEGPYADFRANSLEQVRTTDPGG